MVVAGVPFSAIGNVDPSSGRFVTALAGAGIALAAAVVVVAMAARVLGGPGSSLVDIARSEKEIADIPEEFTVDGEREQSWLERYENRKVVRYLRSQPQLLRGYLSVSEVVADGIKAETDPKADPKPHVQETIDGLVAVGGWQQVLRRYRTALAAAFVGSPVIAAGLVLFILGAYSTDGEATNAEGDQQAQGQLDGLVNSIGGLEDAVKDVIERMEGSAGTDEAEEPVYGSGGAESDNRSYVSIAFDASVVEDFASQVPCEADSRMEGALEETAAGSLRINIVPSNECQAFAMDFARPQFVRAYSETGTSTNPLNALFGDEFNFLAVVDPEVTSQVQALAAGGCQVDDVSTAFLDPVDPGESPDSIVVTIPESATCPGAHFELDETDYVLADSGGTWIDPGS